MALRLRPNGAGEDFAEATWIHALQASFPILALLLRAFTAALEALRAMARCSSLVRALARALPPLLPIFAKYLDSSC